MNLWQNRSRKRLFIGSLFSEPSGPASRQAVVMSPSEIPGRNVKVKGYEQHAQVFLATSTTQPKIYWYLHAPSE